MKASVGVFNMAKGRAATMAAIWVQLPAEATEIFSPKVHIDRGADLSPLLNGQRGDANPARKAAGHFVPRLRIGGAIPALPHTPSMPAQ